MLSISTGIDLNQSRKLRKQIQRKNLWIWWLKIKDRESSVGTYLRNKRNPKGFPSSILSVIWALVASKFRALKTRAWWSRIIPDSSILTSIISISIACLEVGTWKNSAGTARLNWVTHERIAEIRLRLGQIMGM